MRDLQIDVNMHSSVRVNPACLRVVGEIAAQMWAVALDDPTKVIGYKTRPPRLHMQSVDHPQANAGSEKLS